MQSNDSQRTITEVEDLSAMESLLSDDDDLKSRDRQTYVTFKFFYNRQTLAALCGSSTVFCISIYSLAFTNTLTRLEVFTEKQPWCLLLEDASIWWGV